MTQKQLATDNAAMIAITGYYKYQDKDFCPIDAPAYSRVSIWNSCQKQVALVFDTFKLGV